MKISHYRQAGRPGQVWCNASYFSLTAIILSCHSRAPTTTPSPDSSPTDCGANKSQTRYEQPLTSPEPRGRKCHVFIINLYEETLHTRVTVTESLAPKVKDWWWFYSSASSQHVLGSHDVGPGGRRETHYRATNSSGFVCRVQAGRRKIISQRFVCPAQTSTVSTSLLKGRQTAN